jgi:hypothetical protein
MHSALATMLFLAASAAAPRPAPIEIPFHWTPGQIEIEVSVNGSAPRWFLLDSGAEYSAIDSDLVRALGLPSTTPAVLAKRAVLAIGPIELRPESVVAMSFDHFRKRKRDINGVIGYELFQRYAVTFDYARKVVILEEPKAFRPRKEAVRLPLTFAGKLSAIEVGFTLPDGRKHTASVMLDSGASQAMIFRHPYATEHHLLEAVTATTTSPSLAQGTLDFGQLVVKELRIGPWRLASPATQIYMHRRAAGGGTDTDGLIGNDVLRRFRVTFDYSRKALWLEPTADLHVPFWSR